MRVGNKEAAIDIPLVPLIRSLWEQDCETTACCQDTGGPKPGDVGIAYVGFASRDLGADRLTRALTAAGIPHEAKPSELRIPLVKGAVLCHLVFEMVAVSFRPDRIPEVTSHRAERPPSS